MKYLLLTLLLAACGTTAKYVVENETITPRYEVPYPDGGIRFVTDTILQVHTMAGNRLILYGFPDYTAMDWVPNRLKRGDTILWDRRHNYLKATWRYKSWEEPNYY